MRCTTSVGVLFVLWSYCILYIHPTPSQVGNWQPSWVSVAGVVVIVEPRTHFCYQLAQSVLNKAINCVHLYCSKAMDVFFMHIFRSSRHGQHCIKKVKLCTLAVI